ncbi:MAG TPA: hypothetical protein EYQ26_15485 [Rhodospirillales bacterium]|nr:hypothetical protein [Rhodospirillales bacterium]
MDMTKYAGTESKWLKASDLQGGRPKVKIASIELLEFEDENKNKVTKPAVKFDGKDKGMVLNATSVEEMIRAFGADSDKWVGKEIILSTKYYKSFDREGIVLQTVADSDVTESDLPF